MGVKLGKMTLRSVFKKPETVMYPFEQRACPEGRKGTIENDMNLCILCGICLENCPKGAVHGDVE